MHAHAHTDRAVQLTLPWFLRSLFLLPTCTCMQVQELKGLHKLRQLVHTHLGGPAEYIMFGQEFGVVGGASFANQLGAIALIVYARTRDVRAGAFEMTAVPKAGGQQVLQGKNMLVFRAGNKGAVCLPFRLHQSTLVVAAAHLPADGSRGSKVSKASKGSVRQAGAIRQTLSRALSPTRVA